MTGPRLPRPGRRTLWAAALAAFVLALGASAWLLGAPPPRRIRLATGEPPGGFATLGPQYKARLERLGLQVELVASHGSVENLRRLLGGEVDVAFAQAGAARALDDVGSLVGLAAVGSEPLWIFSTSAAPGGSVRDLRGRKIAVGPPDSGTSVLARQLLAEYGITEANTTFLPVPMAQVGATLADRTADAAFVVCAFDAPLIGDLLPDPRVRLVSLGPHRAAIAHRFRYLRPVELPRGGFDLEHDLPPENTALLAPRTVLVAREDLHPRVVELLLTVAQAVHGPGNRLDDPDQFPSLDGMDLPPHVAAERFMKTGESFLSLLLPYWGLRMVWQVQLLLLPSLALLLPFWKTLPLIYSYRFNHILRRHYAALSAVESRIDRCLDSAELRRCLEAVDRLRSDLEALSRKLPGHLQRDVYQWRLHVALVRTEGRDRLRRLEDRAPEPVDGHLS
jgi:TRAP transporter TAXI family solute receptor